MSGPSCEDCKFMEKEVGKTPFCVHPKANPIFGTVISVMRSDNPVRHAIEHCGPEGKFFEAWYDK